MGDVHLTDDETRVRDRALIYETLVRMAAGLDRPDYALYSDQMTDDVETVLGGDLGHPGFPQKSASGQKAAWNGAMAIIALMDKVTHYVMNVDYNFSGASRASTRAEALITMLNKRDPATGSQVLLQRGFRYEDQFVRQGNRWLISRRVMIPLWMVKGEAVPVDYSTGTK